MVAMKLLPALWLHYIYRMQEQDGTKKIPTMFITTIFS